MNKIKIVLSLVIILTFFNCGSVSDYSNNKLNKEYYKSKTIYFTLNQNSVKQISVNGMAVGVLGGYKAPDIKQAFRESIQELSLETKINLQFIETYDKTRDSDMIIDVEISEAIWSFGFSVATFKTNVNYNIQNGSKLINTIGIRKSGGGSESNNLRKSLKNANYKLLQELEKSVK